MIDIIQYPSIACAYSELLTHGCWKHDGDEGEGVYGFDGEEIPSPEAGSASTQPSKANNNDVGISLVCEKNTQKFLEVYFWTVFLEGF